MQKIDVNLKILCGKEEVIPAYQSEGSSGCDIRSLETYTLKPFERRLFSTGVSLGIPQGYEVQIRPRSGLAIKHGVTVLNTPGTVDSDYTGEIKVILINLGNEDYTVNSGDRIAQLVLAPVVQAKFVIVNDLAKTIRGVNGFNSTGYK